MEIKQFYDKNLAHASYAVLSENEIALIDPGRDPAPYYEFAKVNNARIIAVIETHPHADFVSSHLEISKATGANIYVSSLSNPFYEYIAFDEGEELKLGSILLNAINTPGHSPDSISIIIKNEDGQDYALATGDTLLVGDVGRPDLRESSGSINKAKEELARMMFRTINEKLKNLPENLIVYPAHGAGSLCGKSTSKETFSTIGKEKKENYAFQPMSEENFVKELLKDQSYVPKYFPYNVDLNRKGAPDYEESIRKVERISSYGEIEKGFTVIDSREKEDFANGHIGGAINLKGDMKFETWLGSVVSPAEKFYLISDSDENLEKVICRIAKIGYEQNISGALVHEEISGLEKSDVLDIRSFKEDLNKYTIVDVRNKSEVEKNRIFEHSIRIPLHELRERLDEVPQEKPVVVHCASGSRSSAASSIIESFITNKVYDLGEAVKNFF